MGYGIEGGGGTRGGGGTARRTGALGGGGGGGIDLVTAAGGGKAGGAGGRLIRAGCAALKITCGDETTFALFGFEGPVGPRIRTTGAGAWAVVLPMAPISAMKLANGSAMLAGGVVPK